jgi:NTP pyrophosphatase (non-canonical NTP hydrolase)
MSYPIEQAEWKEKARTINMNARKRMGLPDAQRKLFLTLAIAGEVGELANLLKKQWRDGVANDAEQVKELADIRIYLLHLFDVFGVDEDIVCASKIEEVAKRPFAQPVVAGLSDVRWPIDPKSL